MDKLFSTIFHGVLYWGVDRCVIIITYLYSNTYLDSNSNIWVVLSSLGATFFVGGLTGVL